MKLLTSGKKIFTLFTKIKMKTLRTNLDFGFGAHLPFVPFSKGGNIITFYIVLKKLKKYYVLYLFLAVKWVIKLNVSYC